jgi:hypothetical protein
VDPKPAKEQANENEPEEHLVVMGTVPTLRDTPFTEPYVRAKVTFRLIWLFAGSVLASFITFWVFSCSRDWRDIKDVIELVLTPEIAILGTALGFYFGNPGRP